MSKDDNLEWHLRQSVKRGRRKRHQRKSDHLNLRHPLFERLEDRLLLALTDGLLSWWAGEGDGQDSWDGNHGTLQNGTTFAPGKVGQGFSLDGVDDYIDAGSDVSLRIAGDVSIAAWLKLNSTTSYAQIIGFGADGETEGDNYLYAIDIQAGGDIGLLHEYSAGNNQYNVFDTNLGADQWYHIAATRDAQINQWKLYLDGQEFGTYAYANDATGGTAGSFIVSHGISSLNGKIDEVAVYNRTLNASEIQALAEAPAFTDALVGWWRGEGNANDFWDGNHGTLQNGVDFAPGIVGQAFSLDGIDDFVSIPDSASQQSAAFTVDAWINLPQAPVGNPTVLASKYDGNSHGWIFWVRSDLGLEFDVLRTNWTSATVQSPAAISSLNTWVHVAATYDGTALSVYADGVLKGSTTLAGGYSPTATDATFGKASWADYSHTNVLIDEAHFYDRALTPGEIEALAQVPSSGVISGQKFHDLDRDGQRDAGEPGLDGWTIELVDQASGEVVATGVTASVDLNNDLIIDPETEQGLYSFSGLAPGDYYVREVLQPGWQQTFPHLPFFTREGDFAVGAIPTYPTAADLDRDGDLDLVIVNLGSDNVSVLLNNGDGTFAPAQNFAVAVGPRNPAAGDLDGDGDIDLAVPSWDSNSVSILLNNGDGSFAPAVNVSVGANPTIARAGDIDDDGDIDLAVVNHSTGTISLLVNDGNASFAHVSLGTGSYPHTSIMGDLDGDLDLDLAVTRATANVVSVFLNNGAGSFVSAGDFPVGNRPLNLVSGDLDGDGDLDLVASNVNSADFSVLKNKGDGTFEPAVNSPIVAGSQVNAAADLDGDGDLDLIVDTVPGTDTIYLNNGDGTFTPPQDFGEPAGGGTPGDFDGDGDLDLARSDYQAGTVSILRNLLGTHILTLNNGELISGLDFGNLQLGEIHGQKFNDLDGDGQRDAGELGLDGWTIELVDASTGALVASTTTSSVDLNGDSAIDPETEQGVYSFAGLAAGDYRVREVLQPGWQQSFGGGLDAPTGLVSWWDGDSISGTTAFDIEDGNDGTLVNGATTAPGIVGDAFSLDGTNDYVEIPDSAELSFTGPFSVELFAKLDSFGDANGRYFLSKGGRHYLTDEGAYNMQVRPGGVLAFDVLDSLNNGRIGALSTDTLSTDTWYHIVGTYDGGTTVDSVKLYVNGELWTGSDSFGTFVSLQDTNEPVHIGRGVDAVTTVRYFDGLIDEVSFYDKALSQVAVQAIFDAGSAGKIKRRPLLNGQVLTGIDFGNHFSPEQDLLVSATSSPATAAWDETIAVSWTVTNQGTQDASADWFDAVYVSTNDQLDAGDVQLAEEAIVDQTPLTVGENYTINRDVTVPAVGTGQHYLLFVADRDDDQVESDDANNVHAVAIDLTAPDLVVSAASSPASAAWDETVSVSWTVVNQGTADAASNWFDGVFISTDNQWDAGDVQIAEETIADQTPLAVGAEYTVNRDVTIPTIGTGTHYLLFVTDRDSNQLEADETNNVLWMPIDIAAPDLIVDSVVVPGSAEFGQTIDVSWTVRNAGDGPASRGWSDRVWFSNDATLSGDDVLLRTQGVDPADVSLNPAGTYTSMASVTLPLDASSMAGTFFLIIETDGLGNQPESNETNNLAAQSIDLSLPPLPDLVVSDIAAPIEALSGQSIEIAWTVLNQGAGDATGTWSDKVYFSTDAVAGGDQLFGTFSFTGTIPAGQSILRKQLITLPIDITGPRWVVVHTDADGELFEHANDTNNTTVDNQSIDVRLAPIPNLVVSNVAAPPSAFSGQQTVVEWTITNIGTGPTGAPTWFDSVWLSLDQTFDAVDTFLGNAANASYLNAGDSYTNSLTVTLPQGIDGNYYFLVRTDDANHVNELGGETDNVTAGGPTNVQLTPPPDLQVESVSAPLQTFSGQTMSLSWNVINAGPGATLGSSWRDDIFMSTDPVLDAGDPLLGSRSHSGALDPGQGYPATQDVTLPIGVSGVFFFFVKTDAGNQVFEHAFESNNEGFDATTTTVNLTPPPDLEVELVDAPATGTATEAITVNYRVTNFGATVTPNTSWQDSLYFSTDAVFDPGTDILVQARTHFGALDAGVGYDASFAATVPDGLEGSFFAFVVTDAGNAVFELDNANNAGSDPDPVVISLPPPVIPPDLVVTNPTAPAVAEAGGSILVSWDVENVGPGETAVSTWFDRLVISPDNVLDGNDTVLATRQHTGLVGPGGSYSVSNLLVVIPFLLPAGSYFLFLTTDHDNRVAEGGQDANNSSPAIPLTLTRETGDLVVTQVTAPPAAQSGQTLNVSWTVQNLGAGGTNANFWHDDVYLSTDSLVSGDDLKLGRVQHSNSLSAGESYTTSRDFSLPIDLFGSYFVLVRTDATGLVIEDSGEGNNDGASPAQTSVALSPTPDLVVTTVDAPTDALSGQQFALSWTVQNQGAANAAGSWFDSVYLSLDQIFDRATDTYLGFGERPAGLAPGESYSANGTFTIPRGLAGPLYVFVAADGGGQIHERVAGELNNVGYDGQSMLVAFAPPADLVTGTITVPANGVPGQTATISYTVDNLGANAALGTWFDSIYISDDDQWDIGDAFFGRVQHSGDVPGGGGSYSESLTAPLPGVLPGDYHVIIRSDIRNHIAESNEANNLGASLDEVTIDAEELFLETPIVGTLAQGTSVYYRVNVPAGETLLLDFDSQSATASNEFYVRYGQMPTRAQFDVGFSEPFSPDQELVVSGTRAGDYYILAYGDSVPGGPANYTLEAQLLSFVLQTVSPNHGSNVGQTTVILSGAKFSVNDVISLVASDGSTAEASRSWWRDDTELWATFDLQGLATGLYDVRIDGAGQTAEATDAFTVNNGEAGQLDVQLRAPSSLRPGQLGVVTVEYANSGETDIVAPLLMLSVQNGLLRLAGQTDFTASDAQFLGINRDGPAGILSPGSHGSFAMVFRPTGGSVGFSLAVPSEQDVSFDWSEVIGDGGTTSIPAEAWDAIWANFTTEVGDSLSEFNAVMADNATRLSQLGDHVSNVSTLLAFELQQATGSLPRPTLVSAFDIVDSTPGLALAFGRTFQQSLAARYSLGSLGLGWTHQWEISATSDPQGNVTIQGPGVTRFFAQRADGSFAGSPGDYGTLTRDQGVYRLRETTGTSFVFRFNGDLDYVEDTNANRISAVYSASQLTELNHTNGDSLTLNYNAQGRISQVTNSTGQTTTYMYDGTGEHLQSVTRSDGTFEYTYDTGGNTARRHALLSIAFPGGTHQFFDYDNRGWLIGQSRDGGEEAISYSYDSAGGVSITDVAGATETRLYDASGRVGQVHDPLDRSTILRYDANGNLVSVIGPGGISYSNAYDDFGNIVSQIDPLGRKIEMTYDTTLNRLTSIGDARGNTTEYDYDADGNLLSITYPDTAHDDFNFDPLGNLIESTNRRGNSISYQYNNDGLLTGKDFEDGSHVGYTYDVRGNTLTATDASGTTTMRYDLADRLERIDYPSGRFLRFSYDAGGRRTQSMDQDGFTVNYHYDAVGRLIGLTDGSGEMIVDYIYDDVGRLTRKYMGNSTYSTYEYDAGGQLLHLVNYAPDDTVNSRFDYTYDILGLRTSMTTIYGMWTYEYDATGQLTHAVLDSTDPSIPSQDLTYLYDAAGNRIRTVENGNVTDYVTNNVNQYTTVGTAAYTYDADGNLVSVLDGAATATYTYDDENRLTALISPDGSWSYEYDAFGNRVAKVHDGNRIEYLLDPIGFGEVTAEYDSAGNQISSFVHGFGLVAAGTGDAWNFYDFDGLGSTAGISGEVGAYGNYYVYEPFGSTLLSTETITNSFEFVGAFGVTAEENGMHFMRARYYQANRGRFTSPDPLGQAPDVNLFRYVGNSPLNAIDPLGLVQIPGARLFNLPNQPPDNPSPEHIPDRKAKDICGPTGCSGPINRPSKPPEVSMDGSQIWRKLPPPSAGMAGLAPGKPVPRPEPPSVHDPMPPVWPTLPPASAGMAGLAPGTPFPLPVNPLPPSGSGPSTSTNIIRPIDPNDIVGPAGFGADGWVNSTDTLDYTIRFENQATASAPAQQVTIAQTLDHDLDPRTFRVEDFGWGSFFFDVPDNQSFYIQRLDLIEELGFFVDVTAGINVATAEAFWTITTIDPATGEVPTDALAGFLPPNDENGAGEGFVSYQVRSKRTAQTGDVIDAEATIIFDINEPIDTPPIFNTLDAGVPTSMVDPLPAILADTTFTLTWSGMDDADGSGLADFDIFVSEDGGPFTTFLSNTTLTSAQFVGEDGKQYAFYSRARDNAGNVEIAPPTPDAVTTLDLTPPVVADTTVQDDLTQRSYVNQLYIDFAEQVNLSDLIAAGTITNAITLTNLGENADVDPDQPVPLTAGQFQYEFDSGLGLSRLTWSLDQFAGTGTSLADGYYLLTLDASLIADLAGNPLDGDGNGTGGDNFVLAFHRLQGDADGNTVVDSLDMQLVNDALGAISTSPTWNPNADLDRDGRITVRDRIVVARSAGNQIVSPAGVSAPLAFLTGDFNGSGAVESGDLAVWEANYGSTDAGPFEGAADGDVVVSGFDFLAWQRSLGTTIQTVSPGAGQAAAISAGEADTEEPAAAFLVGSAFAATAESEQTAENLAVAASVVESAAAISLSTPAKTLAEEKVVVTSGALHQPAAIQGGGVQTFSVLALRGIVLESLQYSPSQLYRQDRVPRGIVLESLQYSPNNFVQRNFDGRQRSVWYTGARKPNVREDSLWRDIEFGRKENISSSAFDFEDDSWLPIRGDASVSVSEYDQVFDDPHGLDELLLANSF